jgi:hypothetical protein
MLQPWQTIKSLGWQWTLLNSSERILELLGRRHADQDGKPSRGFGQACGKAFLHQGWQRRVRTTSAS